jgi:hypothetical protein
LVCGLTMCPYPRVYPYVQKNGFLDNRVISNKIGQK